MVKIVGKRRAIGVMYGQIWRYITAGARVPRHYPGSITQVTKISNRHLQALEQEHFDVLPGGVFNKSMVREYARVVGLDQEEWVGRYLSAHKPTGALADEDGWVRFAENASKARGDSSKGDTPRSASPLGGHWGSPAPGGGTQLVCLELRPQEDYPQRPRPVPYHHGNDHHWLTGTSPPGFLSRS